MRVLPIVIFLSVVGGAYWVFATFALLDIFSWAFIIVALLALTLLALRVLAPKGEKHG